jgi:hypothetical protein
MRAASMAGLFELRRDPVEPLLARLQVVLEDVADDGDHGVGVLEEGTGNADAPPPAPQDAETDGGIRLGAKDDAWLQNRDRWRPRLQRPRTRDD